MFHGPRTVLCPTLPSVSVPPPAASAPGRTPGTGPGDRSAVPIVPALRPRPEARGLPRTRVRVLDRRPGGPVHRALAPGRRGTLHAPRGTPVAPRSVGRAPHARRRQPVRRADVIPFVPPFDIPPLHNVERGTLKDSLTVAGGEDTTKGAGSGEPGAGFLAILLPAPCSRVCGGR